MSGWPVGATSRSVDLGASVHALDFGGPEGAPVVLCVHGLGGSALNFGLLGPELARSFRVLAVDLLGHGGSGVPDAHDGAGSRAGGMQAEVDRQVRMLSDFVDEVVGEPVVLVGHSLGGVISALYALERPQDVSRLVLLGPPVPHAGADRRDRKLAAKLAFLRMPGVGRLVLRTMRRTPPDETVRRQLADATPHVDAIPAEAVTASIEETARRSGRADAESARRLQWQSILGTLSLLAGAADWRLRLDGLQAPVLWLHGEDDLLSPVADGRDLATGRGWEFRSRPGVGHLPHLEDVAWTAEQIAGWSPSSGEG
ncbi:alpha/beta fold hydrolase [Alloalcanivorax gelatiniphagus]